MKKTVWLFAVLVVLAAAHGAQAHESGEWVTRMVGYNDDGTIRYARYYCREGRCYRSARQAYARPYRRYPTRVYSYERRAHEEEVTCRDTRRVVGDQHLTLEGAKKAANDAWAGAVRFHLGEKYMDLANARHLSYTCSRSSIKEGGVTTLGQTLTRCEVEAQPCHAPRTNESSER